MPNSNKMLNITISDKNSDTAILHLRCNGEFSVYELIDYKKMITELIDDMIVEHFTGRFEKQ